VEYSAFFFSQKFVTDRLYFFKIMLCNNCICLYDSEIGLWQNLNPDNKVSLFARVIDLDSGETGDMIFNKYDAVNSDLDDPEEPELLPEELELLAKLDAEAE